MTSTVQDLTGRADSAKVAQAQLVLLGDGHGRSNCASLFGIAKIPSGNHIRDMLDPAAPALLRPEFPQPSSISGKSTAASTCSCGSMGAC